MDMGCGLYLRCWHFQHRRDCKYRAKWFCKTCLEFRCFQHDNWNFAHTNYYWNVQGLIIMAKYTVLQLTQSILSSMNSEEVNSINDTPEALQVANCIKTAYEDIVGPANLIGDFDTFQVSNATGEVLMTIP